MLDHAGVWFAWAIGLKCLLSPVPQVKFTQQNWHDRLTTILDDFPKVRLTVVIRSSARSS